MHQRGDRGTARRHAAAGPPPAPARCPAAASGAGRRPRAGAGFTLVELMIAVFILSVGILSVGRLFVFAQNHSAHGRQETMAVSLAQEIREKILSKQFDEIVPLFDGVDTDLPDTITLPCQTWAEHLAAGLGPSGRGTVEILDHLGDPEITGGMLTVRIGVSWIENGARKEAPMRFSLSRMGI